MEYYKLKMPSVGSKLRDKEDYCLYRINDNGKIEFYRRSDNKWMESGYFKKGVITRRHKKVKEIIRLTEEDMFVEML